MHRAYVTSDHDFESWRDAARALILAGIPPQEIDWRVGEAAADASVPPPLPGAGISVPKGFFDIARLAIAHDDPNRFGLLYALLYIVAQDRSALSDRSDPLVARVEAMAHEVSMARTRRIKAGSTSEAALDALRQEAEEKVRQQQEWFSVPLASIGDAVITANVAGEVTVLNAVGEAMTGWKAADAIGQPIEKVFHVVNEHTRAWRVILNGIKPKARRLGHEHTTLRQQKRARHHQPIQENFRLLMEPIAVRILQNRNTSHRLVLSLPVRVRHEAAHFEDPHASIRIELQRDGDLHGRFVDGRPNLETWSDLEFLQRRFRRKGC